MKTRKLSWKISVTVLLLAVLILSVAANALVSLLPESVKNPDLSGIETFRISNTTEKYLATLDRDVSVFLICEDGESGAPGDLCSFFRSYAELSDHLTFSVVDPGADKDFIRPYGGEWPEKDLTLLIASGSRYKFIDNASLYYYYNSYLDIQLTAEQYNTCVSAYMNNDQSDVSAYQIGSYLAQYVDYTSAYFDGDSLVTNAVHAMTLEKTAKIYFCTGIGSAFDSTLLTSLKRNAYDYGTLLDFDEVPADCDLLVIYAPSSDLSEKEAAAVKAYLAAGGKLFVGMNNSYLEIYTGADISYPNINSVLSLYGLSEPEKAAILYEGNSNYCLADTQKAYPYYILAHVASEHAATGAFDGSFVGIMAEPIEITETSGVNVTKWLYTSEAGYTVSVNDAKTGLEEGTEKAAYPFGVIAEKDTDGSAVIWISTPEALTSSANSMSQNNGNQTLTLSALNWLCGVDNQYISIAPTAVDTSSLHVSVGSFAVWAIVLVLLIPAAAVTVGVIIWMIRKKK